MEFITKTGCKVNLHEDDEHLGPGLMMIMRMSEPGHLRVSELYLDDWAIVKLSNYLTLYLESRRDMGL